MDLVVAGGSMPAVAERDRAKSGSAAKPAATPESRSSTAAKSDSAGHASRCLDSSAHHWRTGGRHPSHKVESPEEAESTGAAGRGSASSPANFGAGTTDSADGNLPEWSAQHSGTEFYAVAGPACGAGANRSVGRSAGRRFRRARSSSAWSRTTPRCAGYLVEWIALQLRYSGHAWK